MDVVVINAELVVRVGGEEGEVLSGDELKTSVVECEDGGRVDP